MSEFEEVKIKKYPYKITVGNWILYLIASLITVVMYAISNSFSAEMVGFVIGIFFAYFIFASAFGLLFWYLLGRKEKGGSTTFNVLIIIILIGQINQIRVQNSNKRSNLDTTEIKEALHEYKNNVKNDSINSDEALHSFATTFEKNIDKFIENTEGEERALFVGLKEFLQESLTEANLWNAAFYKIDNEAFFNFDSIQKSNKIENRLQIAEEYVKASERYKDFFKKRLSKLNAIIKDKDIDRNNSKAKGIIDGVKKKVKKQSILFIPYIDSHIEYGNEMKGIFQLIKENKWKPNDVNFVIFSNPKIQIEFDAKINKMVEIEEKVNLLHEKLVDAI
ncbi:hypothetical protein [Flavobacterium sp. J27]|uniref:hypothetical protein n=1 Tax=Flavobacterium sp. J27 TaxID=2060419 RepID=UPI0010327001|nr:hypothetical protein [Flavobacterium sp. J27]